MMENVLHLNQAVSSRSLEHRSQRHQQRLIEDGNSASSSPATELERTTTHLHAESAHRNGECSETTLKLSPLQTHHQQLATSTRQQNECTAALYGAMAQYDFLRHSTPHVQTHLNFALAPPHAPSHHQVCSNPFQTLYEQHHQMRTPLNDTTALYTHYLRDFSPYHQTDIFNFYYHMMNRTTALPNLYYHHHHLVPRKSSKVSFHNVPIKPPETINQKLQPESRRCMWIKPDETIDETMKPCGKIFRTIDDIALHVNEEHVRSQTDKSYGCRWQDCSLYNKRTPPSILIRHIRMHTGEKPFKCEFKGCDSKFMNIGTLKRHSFIHTKGRELYSCEIRGCGKSYKYPCNLRRHKKKHESRESEG